MKCITLNRRVPAICHFTQQVDLQYTAARGFSHIATKERPMKSGSTRILIGVIMATLACLLGVAFARGQAAQTAPAGQAQRPQMAEEVFTNVQVLKGIPVDEFMDTMGMFAASLSLNCIDCHVAESVDKWEKFADETPLKRTARTMVQMVNAINKQNFKGVRSVTCYTCHRGDLRPKVVPSLIVQYSAPDEPLPLMTLAGGNLEGAKIDAIVSFPPQIKQAFAQWRVGATAIEDKEVVVLQGTNPRQPPVNFYFDSSGLLIRVVRLVDTAMGRVPTQIDYSDYRDVAGVKMPFHWTTTWTDGQATVDLTEVQPNPAIDAARFARPAPAPRPQ